MSTISSGDQAGKAGVPPRFLARYFTHHLEQAAPGEPGRLRDQLRLVAAGRARVLRELVELVLRKGVGR